MANNQITLSIDGQKVTVPAGSTLLEAARQAGSRIPTLCNHDHLPPGEACRLCVVEVMSVQRPVAACAFLAQEGLEVNTLTFELEAERKTILRLALADHYGDCIAPCSLRCPANIDIQGYIALIARRRYLEATQLIRRSNPLPLTCGRVCPHPCESQCRRGRVDEPININHLKRFASDIAYRDLDKLNPSAEPKTGKSVAVVGGGPAGLTAAYYLALKGHRPVIYEANPQLGGMLRYGIPEYRLPKHILDREIEAILRTGVEVRTGELWGRDFQLSELRHSHDALFLGTGAAVNRELDFLSNGLTGVNYGTCFLGQVALGQNTVLKGKVGVIGGGNTAMDCARTAVRLGADEVTILYRRSRKEMPAQESEVREAEEEGIRLELCVAPVGARMENGCLAGMTFVRMDLCEIDASGRARPKPIEGSEFEVPLDYVIVAVGQMIDEAISGKDPVAALLERTKWQTIKGDYLSGATSQEGIFAAGDLTTGPATVVEAIGGARRAAEAMDRWLRGNRSPLRRPFIFSKGTLQKVDQQNFANRLHESRASMPTLAPQERRTNFNQVELGLSEEQAVAEAKRCLACGCQATQKCLLRQAAEDLGINELVAQEKPAQPWSIRDDHPLVLIEDGKCILCRRCERACTAYHGRDAIHVLLSKLNDLAGFRSHRVAINDRCDECGLCVQVCPTGALSYKTSQPLPGPFDLEWRKSLCNLCPLNCRVKTGSIANILVRVEGYDSPPAFGHLCRRGRLELAEAVDSASRLTKPLLRRGAELVEVGWGEAFSELGLALGRIKREAGQTSLAGLSLGRASLEELYLFGKLTRLGLMTNNLDFMAPNQEDPQSGRLLADLAPRKGHLNYPAMEYYDLVVLLGREPNQGLPLLESSLHRMLARGGKLIIYGGDEVLNQRASLQQDASLPEGLQAVHHLLKGNAEDDQSAELFRRAAHILILVSETDLDQSCLTPLYRLSDFCASISNRVHLALLPAVPSVLGLRRAGISPDHYPGHRRRTPQSAAAMQRAWERDPPPGPGLGAKEILDQASGGEIKGLLVQANGLLPGEAVSQTLLNAMQAVEFGVVLASNRGTLTQAARLVLPTPLCLESEGTFMGADGERFETEAALQPPPETHPGWRLLGLMLEVLDGPPAPRELLDVQSEMIVINQVFAEMSHV
jgi:formate dehydrogenase major subunit